MPSEIISFAFQRPARNAVPQGQPLQKLHGDESFAFMIADFINRADIRVVKRGSRPGLAAKTFQSLRILSYTFGQELQGNEAAERCVLGLINHAHPAPAKLFDDAVVRDGLADHRGESYVREIRKSTKVLDLTTRKGSWVNIASTLIEALKHRKTRPQ